MKKEKKVANGFKVLAAVLVWSLISFAGELEAQNFSFRLSGSIGYLQNGAGDLDKLRRGMLAYIPALAEDSRYGTSIDWEKPSRTSDFRAELLFKVSRNFGFSVGSGYIVGKNQGRYSIGFDSQGYVWGDSWYVEDSDYTDYTRKYKIAAIPITLDAYFFLPIGKKQTFTIFAHGGVGYYFGKLRHTMDIDNTYDYRSYSYGYLDYQSDGVLEASVTEKTNSNSFGVHGGLGFEIKMARFVSLGAEAYGRHVEFSDWEGSLVISAQQRGNYWSYWYGQRNINETNTESQYGKLWIYESKDSDSSANNVLMWVLDEEPDEEYFQNASKASLNLNSYGISVSLKLSFNLF